jgi:hypothetical protein
MPVPDYSEILRKKRLETILNVDQQVNPLKFRSTSTFSTYRPYRPSYIPPNFIVPEKLVYQPPPAPENIYTINVDFGGHNFLVDGIFITSSYSFDPVTKLKITLSNAVNINNAIYVRLTSNVGYDFSGISGSVIPSSNPVDFDGDDAGGWVSNNTSLEFLQNSSVITWILPSEISSLKAIIFSDII